MKFLPLIGLRLTHAYHPDGRCLDFAIEPSAETRRWLAGHRCLARQLPGSLEVSAAVQPGQRTPPWTPGSRLVFHLLPQNPEFPLFTDLDAFAANPAPVFTTEGAPKTSPVVLTLQSRTGTQTERLEFPAKANTTEFTLGGRPLEGTPPAEFRVRGFEGKVTASVAAAQCRITVTAPAKDRERAFEVTYPVRPSLPSGVFADIELVVDEALAAATQRTDFEVRFAARTAKWRYYVVSPGSAGTAPYTVDFGQRVVFQPGSVDALDPVGRSLEDQYRGGRAVRIDCFTSAVPLPCLAVAPPDLRLKTPGQSEAGDPLPAPALRNLCEVGGAPALFHVIRKVMNP